MIKLIILFLFGIMFYGLIKEGFEVIKFKSFCKLFT